MCYNHNYFYSQKIIILIRKSWQSASNMSLLNASTKNTMEIQSSIILMSPWDFLSINYQHANKFKYVCNSCISLVWEVFLSPHHIHFHSFFCELTTKDSCLPLFLCPPLFVSVCGIYSRELHQARKETEGRTAKVGFGFAHRSHRFSGGK